MSTRRYRSPARSRQAAETRASVLAAADKLFRLRGWAATTIAAIAAEAGVSAETVYSNFGSKRALIGELVANAVRRDAPDVPLQDQEGPRRVLKHPDPAGQIDLFARDVTDVLSRVAPLMAVVRSAAASEPELGSLQDRLQAGRRENLARFVGALAKNGALRPPLDEESATATVWRLASPELFTLVTEVEGADAQAFAVWLGKCLKRLLLPA